ncbi:MAG: hypothetical protein KDC98_21870 [Planctomycetes bacterium]|nr:hypothetical protein [Planctomycetota bacterium]
MAQSPVVSPADRGQLEGSTFTHLPLGRMDTRMQTLHLDVPGGTVIAGHGYRREAAGVYGSVAAFACDLEVIGRSQVMKERNAIRRPTT